MCMNCTASLPMEFNPKDMQTPPAQTYPTPNYSIPKETSKTEYPGYVKFGIVLGVVFIILVAVAIYLARDTFEFKSTITFDKFQDKYGTNITDDEIGEKEYILDWVSQSHYNASLDMVGVNFKSSGRSTDTTSPYQTYDLMIPGKFRNKFGVGDRIECHVEITKDGPEVFYVEQYS